MPKKPARKLAPAKLLSGGNPQIAKGYGDEPVKAYLDALPGWKSEVCRRIDAIITRVVPDVHKAVKWNSPLYGRGGHLYFLGVHCLTKYVKVAFFQGASLDPMPPGESKQQAVRYLNIHEEEPLDEKRFAEWVKQASRLSGARL